MATPQKSPWLHPASAAVILGLDWLAWSVEVMSGFLATPVTVLLVFAATLSIVFQVQTRLAGDPPPIARRKAVLGALAAAVPFPITGTIVGGWVLAAAGWRGVWAWWKRR